MMAHVAENLLNWVLSLILGAEVDASTLNCIREQLESQRRFECTEVLQKAGILCGLCGKQVPKHFPALPFIIFPWTFAAEFWLKNSLFQKWTKKPTQVCVGLKMNVFDELWEWRSQFSDRNKLPLVWRKSNALCRNFFSSNSIKKRPNNSAEKLSLCHAKTCFLLKWQLNSVQAWGARWGRICQSDKEGLQLCVLQGYEGTGVCLCIAAACISRGLWPSSKTLKPFAEIIQLAGDKNRTGKPSVPNAEEKYWLGTFFPASTEQSGLCRSVSPGDGA